MWYWGYIVAWVLLTSLYFVGVFLYKKRKTLANGIKTVLSWIVYTSWVLLIWLRWLLKKIIWYIDVSITRIRNYIKKWFNRLWNILISVYKRILRCIYNIWNGIEWILKLIFTIVLVAGMIYLLYLVLKLVFKF